MTQQNFDVVIIGGGPGGYVCAIRCAQLGMSVAVIEKRKRLGGTCLNVGCIPSKALLHSSELYAEANHSFKDHGIEINGVKLNLDVMMKKKNTTLDELGKGIEYLFKKNKITLINGYGSIESAGKVKIKLEKEEQLINGKNIIIATGSEVMSIPNVTIDEKSIVSSTGALDLNKVPAKMIVIGGGYIGLEMGSVWSRLGSEVTVVEYLDAIVPMMDKEIGKQLHKTLEKQGLKFKLSTKVLEAKATSKGVELVVEPSNGGDKEVMKADVVLVSVGRRPFTDNLGLEALGVAMERGKIITNAHFATNIAGIYAIGDVINGPMLAHKAEEEGVAIAEILAGQAGHVNYDIIPSVIYTNPEVASVGKTEEELKAAGVAYKVGKFPFMANSRAKAVGVTEGMVKILACSKTDQVLGAHIIGANAGELIHEIVVGMEFKAAAEDIARSCHAHPTLSEAVKEACLAVDGRAIHM
jgi:dihydrolipoamide dehydrogenase